MRTILGSLHLFLHPQTRSSLTAYKPIPTCQAFSFSHSDSMNRMANIYLTLQS